MKFNLDDVYKVAEQLDEWAEMTEPKDDGLLGEIMELSEKAGHDYSDDIIDMWNLLFKGKRIAKKDTVEVELFGTEDDSKQRAKEITRRIKRRGIVFKKKEPDYDWEICNGTVVTLSIQGIGFRTTYRSQKSEYDMKEEKLLVLWISQDEIHEALQKERPEYAHLFARFMKVVSPYLESSMRVKVDNGRRGHELIYSIDFPRPVIRINERGQENEFKTHDGMIISAGAVELTSGDNQQSLYRTGESALLHKSIQPYLEKHIDNIRSLIAKHIERDEKIVADLKKEFAAAILVNSL